MARKRIGDDTPKKHRSAPRSKANLKPAWKAGESGNPAGRPKGSRNKLSEGVLRDFCALWDASGFDKLVKVAKDDPSTFVRLAVSLIPKQLEVEAASAIYVVGDRPLDPDQWAAQFAEAASAVEPAGGTAGSPGKVPAAGSVLRGSKRRGKD